MEPWLIHLQSDTFGDVQIDLVHLEGKEAIGQLYELDLLVIATGVLDPVTVMTGRLAVVFTQGETEVRRIHGVAAEVEERTTSRGGKLAYSIKLVPTAWLASVNETLDICMDMSVSEIIAFKLEKWGIRLGEGLDQRFQQTYPKREFVVQYRESDLAFVSRLAEHLGISITFEQDDTRDIMVFSDHNEAFPDFDAPAPVRFVDEGSGDGVYELRARTRTLPQRYIVRDFNYRTPNVDLTVVEEVPGGRAGDVVEYGAHFKTPDNGKAIASIRVQELLSTQVVFHGESVDPAMRPGRVISVEGHPRGELELLIVSVEHEAEQAHPESGGAPAGYRCRFTAILKDVVYRPPRVTPKPKVQGVLTGMVDAQDAGQYAEIDGEGRYKVKFLYDTAEKNEGQASRPVRMAQPHSGGGYGMHFPLRPGVEVLLSCVDGDPDRPIIQSTVPNPSNPSPVTGGNNARNIIRTGGGNEINIDDTEGSHRIKMTTPHMGTTLQLGAPNDPDEGITASTGGNSAWTIEGVESSVSSLSTTLTKVKTLMSSGNVVTDASVKHGLIDKIKHGVEMALEIAEIALSGVGMAAEAVQHFGPEADVRNATSERSTAQSELDDAQRELSDEQQEQVEALVEQTGRIRERQREVSESQERILALERERREVRSDFHRTAEQRSSRVAEIDEELEEERSERDEANERLGASRERKREMERELTEGMPGEQGREVANAVDALSEAEEELHHAEHAAEHSTAHAVHEFVEDAEKVIKALMAASTLISTVRKIYSLATEVQTVADSVAKWGTMMSALSPARTRANPSLPGLHFNVMKADNTTAMLASQTAQVAGVANAGVYGGEQVLASTGGKLILTSGRDAELAGRMNLKLTSPNGTIDAYAFKRMRLVAHSSDGGQEEGDPQLLIASENEWQAMATSGPMKLIAKEQGITVEAKAHGVLLRAGEGELEEPGAKGIGLFAEEDVFCHAKLNMDVVSEDRAIFSASNAATFAAGDGDGFGVVASTSEVALGKLAGAGENDPTPDDPIVKVSGDDITLKKGSSKVVIKDAVEVDASGDLDFSAGGNATFNGTKVFVG